MSPRPRPQVTKTIFRRPPGATSEAHCRQFPWQSQTRPPQVLVDTIQKPTGKKKYVGCDFAGLPTGRHDRQPVDLLAQMIDRFSNRQMWIKTPGITFIEIQLCWQDPLGHRRLFVLRFVAENFWYKHVHLLVAASNSSELCRHGETRVTQGRGACPTRAIPLPRPGPHDLPVSFRPRHC